MCGQTVMGSKWMNGDEKTERVKMGLIGNPVDHSLSPVMHEAAYEAAGLAWSYDLFPCLDEEDARSYIDLVKDGTLLGLNVTRPFKQFAAESCDELVSSAYITQAVNVVVCEDDKLVGYNTDGDGAVGALIRGGLIVCGSSFLVCGTGATATSVTEALARSGAKRIAVLGREKKSAEELVDKLSTVRFPRGVEFVSADYGDAIEYMEQSDGIVDATSLGMNDGDPSVLPASGFNSEHVVLDVVYGQNTSRLVADARAAGARAFDGLSMLVEQAVLTAYIWFRMKGVRITIDIRQIMREAAKERMRAQGAADDGAGIVR